VSGTAIATRFDPSALLTKAVEGGASIDTLERLLAMAKEVRAEQARAAWHSAMADFQADVPEVVKSKIAKVRTKSGAEYSYQYAPLQDLISAVRPALAKHGLSVVFETNVTKDHVLARCLVGHADGHVQSCEFVIPIDLQSHMNAAQQVASACTYARRYAYMSALGLSPEDDDDGAAATPTREPEARFQTSTQRKVEEAQAKQSDAAPVWRGKLGKVDTKAGSTNGKPWTLYKFTGGDGEAFATFSETTAQARVAPPPPPPQNDYEARKNGKHIVEFRDVTKEEVPL